MLRTLAKLLHVLNSETEPGQISLAVALALVMGLAPFFALHNLVVLLLVLVLRVNLSAFLVSLALFSGIAYVFDPWLHKLGLTVLQLPLLQDLWVTLYNLPLWRLERFNNTLVMGGLVVSLVLFVPLILVCNALIRHYRAHVPGWFKNNRIVMALKSTRLYEMYASISRIAP